MSGKSTLQELRELNVRKQKEATIQEGKSYDHMTDKQTRHISDHTDANQSFHEDIRPSDQQISQSSVNKAGQQSDPSDDRSVGQSVRDRIVASVQGAAGPAKPVLKTVTLKMDPDLDKRVEDHCYAAGRKKQDVIRDAVLLYFEAIESAGKGD